MIPTVVEGDLLDQDVEVLVNAWNRNIVPWWLLWPQGVSGAIKRRAGYVPFREVARHGPIPLGGAVETSAGRLPHRAIIHVAGINAFWVATQTSIRRSVVSAMGIVQDKSYRSVAFPLIGAGTGGGKDERVLAWMQEEFDRIDFAGDARIVRFRARS